MGQMLVPDPRGDIVVIGVTLAGIVGAALTGLVLNAVVPKKHRLTQEAPQSPATTSQKAVRAGLVGTLAAGAIYAYANK